MLGLQARLEHTHQRVFPSHRTAREGWDRDVGTDTDMNLRLWEPWGVSLIWGWDGRVARGPVVNGESAHGSG